MNNDCYVDFAGVYDELMDGVPYQEWAKFVADALREYGVGSAEAEEANIVLDLGCGTGTLTELLSRAGFDMIGIDNSGAMLEIAMRKRELSGSDILYLMQDMREFELYGTVGAVCSVCDSLNYILEDADMAKVFSLVDNYLYPGGVFLFDFNTVFKYESVIGDSTIAENRDHCSLIWENYYDETSQINEYDLTIFVREEGSESFRRFTETHFQRGYTLEQMKGFLEQAGLLFVRALDADTHDEVRETSERIYVIAQEGKKTLQPAAVEKAVGDESCACSRERAERALLSIPAELEAMVADGGPIEMKCPYCDKAYKFSAEELKRLAEK